MKQYQYDFIKFCIENSVLKFGEFTLKSGRLSPYFFNMGEISSGGGVAILGAAYAKTLAEQVYFRNHILFGPAYKGIPIVVTTAVALHNQHNFNIPFCYNRKEVKTHGEGGQRVGPPMLGCPVWILDDVITAGTAIREAIALINVEGGILYGICLGLDRQERGTGELSAIQELKKEHSVDICSIVTFKDLLEFCQNDPELQAHVPAMEKYHEKYGV